MPFVGLVHLAIACFFGIDAVRTGKPIYWLFVLFAFPLLGSVVYFFAIYLPGMRYTRGGIKAARAVQTLVDPNRELREATQEFDRTPTAYNRARLGGALLAKGRPGEAVAHYAEAASGPYASDVSFLRGLAYAQLANGQPAEAAATLRRLFAAHPGQESGELAIAHAEALALARSPEAGAAFAAVLARDDTTEARCKYGRFLQAQGDAAGARAAYQTVLRNAEHGHYHSRELNREWIDAARAGLKELD